MKLETLRRKFIPAVLAITMFAGIAGCDTATEKENTLQNLYAEVDEEIKKAQEYEKQHEKHLENMKMNLSQTTDSLQRLRLLRSLTNAYSAYRSDSALLYVTRGEQLAEELGDSSEKVRFRILKADVASHAGLFGEAHHMLETIDKSQLDSMQLQNLYMVYCSLYQYESEYVPEGEFAARAEKMRDVYTDSLLMIADPNSFRYLVNKANRDIKKGNAGDVIKLFSRRIEEYEPGDREYSILGSILANAYEAMGDVYNHKRYLAKTVISDIKGARKENLAMRELAMLVFEEGDISRANHYVKSSLDDANFYSSRIRNAQSNRILPVIDKAYDKQQERLRARMQGYIVALCCLVVIVLVTTFFVIRQWRRVREANQKEQRTNEELQRLSDRLLESNTALEKSNSALENINAELKKSGRITEEYTGLFMEYSSLNISLLEKYHTALRNLALQGNVKGILKKLDSDDIVNETIKAFYSKFDEAVLNIYPSFVERVNSLLREDGQVVLKPGEKLNTELRVLAVMRLGIVDPNQMAHFLRCSVSTVYTYRSRLKRRAKEPEEFDSRVMVI